MKRLLPAVLLLAGASAPARACDRDALRGALDAAFEAWRARDQVGFRAAREAAHESLACQSELLPRDLVRDLHVSGALSAYLPPRDPVAVRAAFRSALSADPAFALDASLAPQGNLLQDLLEDAREEETGRSEPVVGNGGCVVLVNGREDAPRPRDRPAVLQEACADRVGAIALIPAGGPLPRWAEVVGAADRAAPPSTRADEDHTHRRRQLSVGLGIGGGAALAAAGGLFLAARGQQTTYGGLVDQVADGSLAASEADRVNATRAAANGLGVGAQAAAGLGVGLLTTAIVVRF